MSEWQAAALALARSVGSDDAIERITRYPDDPGADAWRRAGCTWLNDVGITDPEIREALVAAYVAGATGQGQEG